MKNFKELIVWKKAHETALLIYSSTKSLRKLDLKFSHAFNFYLSTFCFLQ